MTDQSHSPPRQPVMILMADDDPDDQLLTRDALAESRLCNELRFVRDGVELLDYLRNAGPFASAAEHPKPGLILLDLNMPRMDGREALRLIREDPALRAIPIVVMTTSKAHEDVVRSYELGVNSFIRKPVSFAGMVDVMRALGNYWFEIVELP
jgi:two-component system response regulator